MATLSVKRNQTHSSLPAVQNSHRVSKYEMDEEESSCCVPQLIAQVCAFISRCFQCIARCLGCAEKPAPKKLLKNRVSIPHKKPKLNLRVNASQANPSLLDLRSHVIRAEAGLAAIMAAPSAHAMVAPTAAILSTEEEVLERIGREFAGVLDDETRSLLDWHKKCLAEARAHGALHPEHRMAIDHIEGVSSELLRKEHSPEQTLYLLKILLQMTANEPSKKAKEISAYLTSIAHEKTEEMATSHSRNDAIDVIKQEGRIVAKVFHRSEDTWDLMSNVECSVAAYEFSQSVGTESVAPMVLVGDSYHSKYVVQAFVPEAVSFGEVMQRRDGQEFIAKLDPIETGVHLLMTLLLGNTDGHANNTLFVKEGNRFRLVEVDLEKAFLAAFLHVELENTDEGQLPAPRMGTMCLPQARQPIPKALLKLFSWDGIRHKAVRALERQGLLQSKDKFLVLFDRMQEIMRFASMQEQSTLTPLDLYFALFGRDWLAENLFNDGHSSFMFFNKHVEGTSDASKSPSANEEVFGEEFLRNCQFVDRNLQRPLFPMRLQHHEKIPGQRVLDDHLKRLFTQELTPIMAMEPGAFDERRWLRYRDFCAQRKRPMRSFIAAECVQGLTKRVARQAAILYPMLELDFVKDNKGVYWLVSRTPQYLLNLQKLCKNNPKGTHEIIEIDPREFLKEPWLAFMRGEVPGADLYSLEEHTRFLRRYFTGHARRIIELLYNRFIMLSSGPQIDVQERDGRLFLIYMGKGVALKAAAV